VNLTPDSATLMPGATLQFTTTGVMSDSTTTAVKPTYVASGGTDDTTGLYTAGHSAGSYRLVATVQGSADTATITVLPVSSGGSGSYPNEPPGAVVLTDYDTDFGALQNCTGLTCPAPWSYLSVGSALSTVTDSSAPVNPSKVGRVRFTMGCCSGTGPARLEMYRTNGGGVPPSGWTSWYVSDWVKFDPNFTPHACCQKIFEFYWNSGGDKWLIVKADPTNGNFPLTARLTAEFSGQATVNYGGQAVIRPGVWYQYEVVVYRTGRVRLTVREKGSTPQVMFDGVMAGFGNPSSEFLFWWWGYGGLGVYPGPTAYINHNHIRVSYTR